MDLFSKDVVVFPINLGSMHWVAGVINMRLKRIEFYDSMGDRSNYRKRIFAVSSHDHGDLCFGTRADRDG